MLGLFVELTTHLCHAVGVACSRVGGIVAIPADGFTANHHNQDFVAFGIGHHSGITETDFPKFFVLLFAQTIGNEELGAPSLTVVGRNTSLDVHFTETDVATTGTIVADSHYLTVLGRADGRNTVGGLSGHSDEKVLLRFEFAESTFHGYFEVREQHTLVRALAAEVGRSHVLQSRYFNLLLLVSHLVGLAVGRELNALGTGNHVLKGKLVARHHVFGACRDAHRVVLVLS